MYTLVRFFSTNPIRSARCQQLKLRGAKIHLQVSSEEKHCRQFPSQIARASPSKGKPLESKWEFELNLVAWRNAREACAMLRTWNTTNRTKKWKEAKAKEMSGANSKRRELCERRYRMLKNASTVCAICRTQNVGMVCASLLPLSAG